MLGDLCNHRHGHLTVLGPEVPDGQLVQLMPQESRDAVTNLSNRRSLRRVCAQCRDCYGFELNAEHNAAKIILKLALKGWAGRSTGAPAGAICSKFRGDPLLRRALGLLELAATAPLSALGNSAGEPRRGPDAHP